MIEHETFFWNQLVTTDQKKSGDFYCEFLGWSRREVDACAACVAQLGGAVIEPPHDIPGVGRIRASALF